MPTRIKPDRTGYTGYTCVGISRPCINDQDCVGNRFDYLPKVARSVVTNTPYIDLGLVAADPVVLTNFVAADSHFDALTDGIFVDLWNAFRRNGLDATLDTTCDSPYNRNDPTGPDFPTKPESEEQIVKEPGFLDPIVIPILGLGNCCEFPGSSSSGSSAGSSESQSISQSEPSPGSLPSEAGSGGPGSAECGVQVKVVTEVAINTDSSQPVLEVTYAYIWTNCDPDDLGMTPYNIGATDCAGGP